MVRIRGSWLLVLFGFASLALAQPTYFVKADMVRAEEGAQGAVCVPNSVFFPGEKIVFRAVVYDAATGEELGFDAIAERGITATVKLEGAEDIAMFYPPASEMPPDLPAGAADYFRGPWPIPQDAPAGMYGWTVEVTDAEGNTAVFTPIGAMIGAGSVTIQAAQ